MAFGVVMLNNDVVGSFRLGDGTTIDFEMNEGWLNLPETLEFASEQGIPLGLMLTPESAGESDV